MTCIGKDPRCPCQDGDACHYKDCGNTKAWPVPQAEPVSCRFCHSKKGCWTWQCYSCGEIDDVQKPTPPTAQRQWVALTDEDRNACLVSADPCEALADPEAKQLMEDVEAALRSKNT